MLNAYYFADMDKKYFYIVLGLAVFFAGLSLYFYNKGKNITPSTGSTSGVSNTPKTAGEVIDAINKGLSENCKLTNIEI